MHFLKYYSVKEGTPVNGLDTLNYEGVGRCTNKKSLRCDYLNADFKNCEKFSLKKQKTE